MCFFSEFGFMYAITSLKSPAVLLTHKSHSIVLKELVHTISKMQCHYCFSLLAFLSHVIPHIPSVPDSFYPASYFVEIHSPWEEGRRDLSSYSSRPIPEQTQVHGLNLYPRSKLKSVRVAGSLF